MEEKLKRDLYAKRTAIEEMMDQLRRAVVDRVDGSVRMAAALFAQADKNGDGSISKEEYLDFIRNSSARTLVHDACASQIERVAEVAAPLISDGIKQIISGKHAVIYKF